MCGQCVCGRVSRPHNRQELKLMAELYVLRGADGGLMPCYAEDAAQIERLARGRVYLVRVYEARNVRLHRKYFALINAAWEACGEMWRKKFRSKENFRKSVTLLAGYTDHVYNARSGEWVEMPRSIAFDRMREDEFEQLYDATVRIIRTQFAPRGRLAREAFEEELKEF